MKIRFQQKILSLVIFCLSTFVSNIAVSAVNNSPAVSMCQLNNTCGENGLPTCIGDQTIKNGACIDPSCIGDQTLQSGVCVNPTCTVNEILEDGVCNTIISENDNQIADDTISKYNVSEKNTNKSNSWGGGNYNVYTSYTYDNHGKLEYYNWIAVSKNKNYLGKYTVKVISYSYSQHRWLYPWKILGYADDPSVIDYGL